MKAKHYIFVTNEAKEVVRFCGLVKRKTLVPAEGYLALSVLSPSSGEGGLAT